MSGKLKKPKNDPIDKDSKLVPEAVENEVKRRKRNEASNFLTIDGQSVSRKQFAVFEAYMETGDIDKVMEITGYSRSGVVKIRTLPWFRKLVHAYVAPRQEQLFAGMAKKVDVMDAAWTGILKGDFPPKLAMAAIQAIKLFAMMGSKHGNVTTAPLMHSNRDLWGAQEAPKEVNININLNIVKKLAKHMTPEEALDWSMTGRLPLHLEEKAQELSLVAKDEADNVDSKNIVDAEYKEIE